MASKVKVLGVRAEAIEVHTKQTAHSRAARVVRKSLGIGGQYLLDLEYGSLKVKARVPHQRGRDIGENVWTSVNSSDIIMFDENGAEI
jgi:ABC-type sugar transport system ATPase subunit